jgi:hypothetical protein
MRNHATGQPRMHSTAPPYRQHTTERCQLDSGVSLYKNQSSLCLSKCAGACLQVDAHVHLSPYFSLSIAVSVYLCLHACMCARACVCVRACVFVSVCASDFPYLPDCRLVPRLTPTHRHGATQPRTSKSHLAIHRVSWSIHVCLSSSTRPSGFLMMFLNNPNAQPSSSASALAMWAMMRSTRPPGPRTANAPRWVSPGMDERKLFSMLKMLPFAPLMWLLSAIREALHNPVPAKLTQCQRLDFVVG